MRNLKKVIALVAVFAMLVSTVAFAATYSDVAEDNNYYEAIEMLSNLGILTGDDADGDGVMDFRPNDTITRAEVAAVVCRIQNINNAAQQNTPFTDVPSSHWASGYVAQAAGQGIINGEGDGIFNPEGNVLYEQAVKMFVRTLGYEPYVEANGGYYTGDLSAATRYGVLDGVVGGTPGAAATRGQIAQMAFNAIDTPLMDRYTYGKDAEYVIYDGKGDYDYMSLMTRYLGIKKFSGILTGSVVTSLTGGKDIDVTEDAAVEFDYDENDDYKNYKIKNDVKTVYAGEAADETIALIGRHVNVYIKEKDNSNDYEVISIAASSKNKVKSYNIDQFDGVDGDSLKFFKSENARTSDPEKLDKDAVVLFNNVYYGDTAVAVDRLITKDSRYSGMVTLIDNGDSSAYDVVNVEIGAPAVVDEVSNAGKVTFKEAVKNAGGDKIVLDFDEEEENQIVKLTKDGVDMDWNELKEWDVLSVLYNKAAEYYDVRVIAANTVDGSVASRKGSETSGDGWEYTIGGNSYDVALGAYGIDTAVTGTLSGLKPGSAGMFYIDNYGKIVAYDKNGSTTQSSTSGNYGYILNTSVTTDDWEKQNIRVQILDKDGKVYEGYLASKVKFENPAAVNLKAGDLKTGLKPEDAVKNAEDDTYDVKNFVNYDKVAEAMKNRLVTYDANSTGELKTITFAKDKEDEYTLWGIEAADYEYDEEDKELTVGRKYDVEDDTIVFYIRGDENITLGSANTASKTASKVATAASLAEKKYAVREEDKRAAAVFDVDNDVPAVVVIFNTSGGISPSTNVAVVDSTGSGYVDGETCESITYFMGGEKKTSYIDSDASLYGFSSAKDLEPGSLLKLSLSADGTMINDAELWVVYGGRDEDEAGEAGAPDITVETYGAGKVVYGPVYDYSSANKRFRIFDAAGTPSAVEASESIKVADANVYVFDPERAKNKLYVGDASDADYDKSLRDKDKEKAQTVITDEDNSKVLVDGNEFALGMMDYVLGVMNSDDDVIDVVIYKAPDFGKYNIVDAE